jgi:hypothetical protein
MGRHFSLFYTQDDRARANRKGYWRSPRSRDGLKAKGGASAKMEASFGQML